MSLPETATFDPASFRLILVDPVPAVCAAWQERFAGLPHVEIVNDYFERLPEFDCLVSAANSFGHMSGGVDAAIIRFFGEPLMERVQRRILDEWRGEQPVGTSMIVRPATLATRIWPTPQPCACRCASLAPTTSIWQCGPCCWPCGVTTATRQPAQTKCR
jgi:hypothetical protein